MQNVVVSNDILDEIIFRFKNHPSVENIKSKILNGVEKCYFQPATAISVEKSFTNLNQKLQWPLFNLPFKTRFWGQNDKSLKNFGVTKICFSSFERDAFEKKNYLYRRSINRIKQQRVSCRSDNRFVETKTFTSPVSLTESVNKIPSSENLLYLNYLQECYQNAAIIPQNLAFKQEKEKLE